MNTHTTQGLQTLQRFKLPLLSLAITQALFTTNTMAAENENITQLDTIKVEADFRATDIQQSTTSTSVVSNTEIEQRSARGLDDIIGLIPNVNASSGASNANYFQIRGMGSTEQFSTPLNPSVGVLVDDFNYTQMGAAATLFDVKQVDVLRGPQGTRFGSSALAGVMQVQTNEASFEPAARVETTAGSRNTYAGGVMLNGPIIADTVAGRLAVYKHTSNGYMENTYLNRKDTQNEDELTARANLKWLVNDRLSLDLKLLHINVDNGYDAFNFDNDYTTISDEPGRDVLKSDGFALKADYVVSKAVDMRAVITQTVSKSIYSYDGDWAYSAYNTGLVDQTDYNERKRTNQALDLRFLSSEQGRIFNNSTDWVAGFYYLKQDEDYAGNYVYAGNYPSGYDYTTQSKAFYGQLDHHITPKLTLIAGMRAENYAYDYAGISGLSKKSEEALYGGKLGASYQVNPNHLTFVNLSRGYKPGGVNDDSRLPTNQVMYDTEYLWNLEAGLNSSMLNNRLNTRLNAFYGLRKDQQVNTSYEYGVNQFVIYTENAAESDYSGLEAQADWLMTDNFKALAALGLLKTAYLDYNYVDGSGNATKLDGREVGRAPAYTFNLGGEYYLSDHWTLAANIEGKDAYYFSNTKPQKSKAYSLVNGALTYVRKSWTVTFWGRNLGDTQYATQGYYFGNDPSIGYTKQLYTQQGEPRTLGLTVAYDY